MGPLRVECRDRRGAGRQVVEVVGALEGVLGVAHVTKYIFHLQDGNQVEVVAEAGGVQVDVWVHAGSINTGDVGGDLLAVVKRQESAR